MGVSEGKAVGEWFGPNTVAQVLKKLAVYDGWSRLAVHVAMDSLLIEADVRTLLASPSCSSPAGEQSSGGSRPLLLLVPLRLGLQSLNSCYIEALKTYFSLSHCVGIIGGRPNHALYFVGVAGDEVVYLDPHTCQSVVELSPTSNGSFSGQQEFDFCDSSPPKKTFSAVANEMEDEFDDSSYHCPFVLHMPIANIDPSLALGFVCQDQTDFNVLRQTLAETLLPASSPPMFEILSHRPDNWPSFQPYTGEETPKIKGWRVGVMLGCATDFTVVEPSFDTDDEFELLG